MKKIIIILIAIFLIIPVNLKALNSDSYVDWDLDMDVFAHQYRNGEDHITNLARMTAGGITAYCIEPGITADKAAYYNSTYNINDTNLKNVDTKKLSLIGYYGYGYEGHNTKEYYMATQELIWRFMGVQNVWWTDQKTGGNTYNIESYKNEIMALVDKYELAPEFNFKDKYVIGEEIELEDKNNVLDGYLVSGNNNVSINGNKIKIKISEDNHFVLKRKQNGKQTKYYYKTGYQTIGTFEAAYDFEKSYNVNYTYGTITVEKIDSDTKENKAGSADSSLEGATYKLMDSSGKTIVEKTTNEEGKIVFDNLSYGVYKIKEVNPSTGYLVNKMTYTTKIETSYENKVYKSEEKIIKNKIVIKKVLEDAINNTFSIEDGITFSIYDRGNNLIGTYTTDENGLIELTLPYGSYLLKQVTTKKDVSFADDTIIVVEEDNFTNYITIVNHKIEKEEELPVIEVLPKTGKDINYSYFLLLPLLLISRYVKKIN